MPKNQDNSDKCENIFDRNTNTIYHSKWTNEGTTFPATYLFNFSETAKFNSIQFKMRFARDCFGLFEVLCGDVNKEFTKTLEETKNSTKTTRTYTFEEIYQCKYLKYVVKNNAQNQNFLVFQDLNLFLTQKYKNLAKPTSRTFNVNGFKVTKRAGHFENKLFENIEEGKGEISFRMKGKRFGIFGDYTEDMGTWEVLVDGKEPLITQRMESKKELPRTLYDIFIFDEGVHEIKMKVGSGFVKVDVIGFG
ncbi:hypothetical protein EIN_453480 [Entamoeba invadens IP1]|uniref:F5/8 type C domain-containing protein n=1 Tax=Entamoeba invadens IP1 TaxID=370355 RepID=L7FMV4_ENTIV|nr:hypothetical protein EIN_453480 [Entamoeba invadens IP1]ELP89698.1 hypothetical protein EIN_453480 [Entamoeba invadens IP1]|eukprot:XP_004256469.1 hypothetical protein EIN_453480 [Entamoeba invadens IP1]